MGVYRSTSIIYGLLYCINGVRGPLPVSKLKKSDQKILRGRFVIKNINILPFYSSRMPKIPYRQIFDVLCAWGLSTRIRLRVKIFRVTLGYF